MRPGPLRVQPAFSSAGFSHELPCSMHGSDACPRSLRLPCALVPGAHLGHFSEEQDAVGGGRVEDQALASVEHQLCKQLEQGCGDGRLVRPSLQTPQQQGEVRWVEPVEQQACAGLAVISPC